MFSLADLRHPLNRRFFAACRSVLQRRRVLQDVAANRWKWPVCFEEVLELKFCPRKRASPRVVHGQDHYFSFTADGKPSRSRTRREENVAELFLNHISFSCSSRSSVKMKRRKCSRLSCSHPVTSPSIVETCTWALILKDHTQYELRKCRGFMIRDCPASVKADDQWYPIVFRPNRQFINYAYRWSRRRSRYRMGKTPSWRRDIGHPKDPARYKPLKTNFLSECGWQSGMQISDRSETNGSFAKAESKISLKQLE